jgi:hypothetical protein
VLADRAKMHFAADRKWVTGDGIYCLWGLLRGAMRDCINNGILDAKTPPDR